MEGSGRPLPWRPPMEEMHRKEREVEAKAELYAQLHPDDEESTHSARAFRRALRRVRDAIRGSG